MTPASSSNLADQNLFLQLRLVGESSEGHTIALSVLKHLAMLEDAIRTIATRQYLADHPEKPRPPKGFFDGIAIELAGFEKGSGSVSLDFACVDKSGDEQPSPGFEYCEQARDAMAARMQLAADGLPQTEPATEQEAEFYASLSTLLAEGGQMEVATSRYASDMILLTPDACQRIMLAPAAEKVSFRGSVLQVDRRKNTLTICLLNGYEVSAEIPAGYHDLVAKLLNGYEDKAKAMFSGTGTLGRDGKLMQLEAIDSMEELDSLDVEARLEELGNFEPGWLDGEGIVPSQEGLMWFEQKFKEHYGDGLPLPCIFPTVEGGVILQWHIGDTGASVEIEFDTHEGEWCYIDFDSNDTDDRILDLDNPEAWQWLTGQMRSISRSGSRDA